MQKNKAGKFFITGTSTGVGKTFVGSLLVRMILADGFSVCPLKPVESGVCSEEKSDMERLLENTNFEIPLDKISPYRFTLPASPHLAARNENVSIVPEVLSDVVRDNETKFDYVLVEGCGGLMVPLNESGFLISDWIKMLDIPVVLVTSRSLGTINHTLLSVEFCKTNKLNLAGIIFSDVVAPHNSMIAEDNVRIIEKLSGVPILGNIPCWTSENDNKFDKNPGEFINRELFYELI